MFFPLQIKKMKKEGGTLCSSCCEKQYIRSQQRKVRGNAVAHWRGEITKMSFPLFYLLLLT